MIHPQSSRRKFPRARLNLFLCLTVLTSALGIICPSAHAQKPTLPEAHIVLFTPADVTAPDPELYRPRLHLFGEYAEQFFHQELKNWDYQPERKEIFQRGADGKIPVIHVKGKLKAAGGAYRDQWISRQVLAGLRDDHSIKTEGNLFWIFVYIGDPPKKHNNFRGAGNSKGGGWAVLNYTNLPGKVSLDDPVVSKFHDELFLKGCIHEFGHALGLPHIGPKTELGKGNTLMGPVTRIYVANKKPDATKAYLSEASAAILSQHPVFTGDPTARNKLPKTEFKNVKVTRDPGGRGITVNGELATNHDVHRIIVIDDRDDKIGSYWVKAYVTPLNARKKFSLAIPSGKPHKGQLKILAVYTNGAFTGNGKQHSIGSATLVPYSFP